MRWRAASLLLTLGLHVVLRVVWLATALLAVLQLAMVGIWESPSATAYLGLASVPTGLGLIVLHELGHAAAAWAVGVPVRHLALTFLTLSRGTDGWQVMRNREWLRPAGYVIPDAASSDRQHAVVLAGGPAMNLVIGVGCLLAAAAVNVPPSPPTPQAAAQSWRQVALLNPGGLVVGWLDLTGLVSLGMSAASLIPATGAGFRSDGGQLIDLLMACSVGGRKK